MRKNNLYLERMIKKALMEQNEEVPAPPSAGEGDVPPPPSTSQAIYSIVGDVPQIFYVKNFIFDTLKKFDKSAQAINDHANHADINFKCVHVFQNNFITDEKRIDSFKPKYITTLTLSYDYTK